MFLPPDFFPFGIQGCIERDDFGPPSDPTPSSGPESEGGAVPRGEKVLYSGTDSESYITAYTLVHEDYRQGFELRVQGLPLGIGIMVAG